MTSKDLNWPQKTSKWPQANQFKKNIQKRGAKFEIRDNYLEEILHINNI